MTIQSRQNKSGGFRRSLVGVPTGPLRKSWRPLWLPSNSALCRGLREHRKNSTACSRMGWRPRNSRRTNFGGPSIGERTPCWPSIKAARVREGFLPACGQRRCCAPVSLLPRYPESCRGRGSFPGFCPAHRSSVASASSCGCALSFEQSAILRNLRSWPVAGFEAIRIYYLLDDDTMHIVRILHGKRDVKHILEREKDV